MIRQVQLGATLKEQKREIRKLIKRQDVKFAGNQSLKIYGRLDCGSGERMKAKNRVFFNNETEAVEHGYRPCGHCMRKKYQKWKSAKL